MRITNFYNKDLIWKVVVTISFFMMSSFTLAHAEHAELVGQSDQSKAVFDHSAHLNEHGGQIYQNTKVDQLWLLDEHGYAQSLTELETRFGTDENKIFIKAHIEKPEAQRAEYEAKVLYSRNISDFWDAQAGAEYSSDAKSEKEKWNAILGIHGLAPYFFETDVYLKIGQDQKLSLELETERDVLLTQKMILKPYLKTQIILNDNAYIAKKTGIDQAELGLEARYEITKQVMPYVQAAYQYHQNVGLFDDQISDTIKHDSTKNWIYGMGLRLRF